MLGSTHLLFSLFFGSFLFAYLHPSTLAAKVVFAALLLMGTFMPDLDLYVKFLKHRGIFHTIWPVIIIVIINFIVTKFSFISIAALALGYGSHLFVDMLTPFGIAPIYPLDSRRIRGPIKAGSTAEFAIAAILVALLLIRSI